MKKLLEYILTILVSLCCSICSSAESSSFAGLPDIGEIILVDKLWCYNGVPYTGSAVYRGSDSTVTMEKQYKDGVWILQRSYYETGTPKREIRKADNRGTLHGPQKGWYEPGLIRKGKAVLEYRTPYRDGKPDGTWTYYHKNGQKSKEGTYHNGEQQGPWKYWYKDGTVNKEGKVKTLTPKQRKPLESLGCLFFFLK